MHNESLYGCQTGFWLHKLKQRRRFYGLERADLGNDLRHEFGGIQNIGQALSAVGFEPMTLELQTSHLGYSYSHSYLGAYVATTF